MKPRLAVAVWVIVGALALSLTAPAAEFPPATDGIADCENRWFLLEGDDPAVRILAFAYVDPSAGVTLEHNGEVVLGEDGALVRKPSALEGKARLISRVVSNYRIACLAEAQVAQLGMPMVPEWLEVYRDTREPGAHEVAWATHYNHIGASTKALEFIRSAIALGHASKQLWYEQSFALNATGQFKEAVAVLEAALDEHPDDINFLAELGYAHLNLREFERGIEVYERALSKDKKGKSGRRSEFAQNIAVGYAQLGDEKRSKQWLEKAEKWKSDGR